MKETEENFKKTELDIINKIINYSILETIQKLSQKEQLENKNVFVETKKQIF